ncbi:hypothetical protein BH23PAT2_BH23PAT2_07250 [soil metagenome]
MSFDGRVGHFEDIDWPWANAGGVVKSIEDVEVMANTSVGWVEAGSYTLEPRLGNAWNEETQQADKIVYHHNSETGETGNSLGMPNKGMDIVEKEIPVMTRIANNAGSKLVVNVAPVSEKPLEESVELVRRAYEAGAHSVILNAGCPNVVTPGGGRHELLSRNKEAFTNVLAGLAAAALPKPIWVRISPQETYASGRGIFKAMIYSGIVSAVLTPNTWPGFKPVDEAGTTVLNVAGNVGGKSGPATTAQSRLQTVWARYALRGSKIDVISSSGIMNGEELAIRLRLGAVAGAGSTFYYEAQEPWQIATRRLLNQLSNHL